MESDTKGSVGGSIAVGKESLQSAARNAGAGTTVEVDSAPEGFQLQVGENVTVRNNSGHTIRVNDEDLKSGEVLKVSAPTQEVDNTVYIVCEACGHHDWEPYLEGWKCVNCGHLRGTSGIPFEQRGTAAAAGGPRSPQTGLWWLLG